MTKTVKQLNVCVKGRPFTTRAFARFTWHSLDSLDITFSTQFIMYTMNASLRADSSGPVYEEAVSVAV